MTQNIDKKMKKTKKKEKYNNHKGGASRVSTKVATDIITGNINEKLAKAVTEGNVTYLKKMLLQINMAEKNENILEDLRNEFPNVKRYLRSLIKKAEQNRLKTQKSRRKTMGPMIRSQPLVYQPQTAFMPKQQPQTAFIREQPTNVGVIPAVNQYYNSLNGIMFYMSYL